LETVLCEYGSAEAVRLGQRAAEGWLGQATTGLILDRGNTLLMVADRAHTDPNGRTLNKIGKAFKK
jgi:hypothetical protein